MYKGSYVNKILNLWNVNLIKLEFRQIVHILDWIIIQVKQTITIIVILIIILIIIIIMMINTNSSGNNYKNVILSNLI
jgi:hypothetical protein